MAVLALPLTLGRHLTWKISKVSHRDHYHYQRYCDARSLLASLPLPHSSESVMRFVCHFASKGRTVPSLHRLEHRRRRPQPFHTRRQHSCCTVGHNTKASYQPLTGQISKPHATLRQVAYRRLLGLLRGGGRAATSHDRANSPSNVPPNQVSLARQISRCAQQAHSRFSGCDVM